jgi:hypothetical protein
MDDYASSARDCSSDSFASSFTSSSPSLGLRRPQQVRQDSSTHIFPARLNGLEHGNTTRVTNSKASRAALQELLNPTVASLGSKDRAQLLNNGLQWLLEASTSSSTPNRRAMQSSVPLSREAVGTLNSKNGRYSTAHGANRKDNGFGTQSTKNWLDDQVKVETLPPW